MDQCYTCWPGAANCNPIPPSEYTRLVVAEHGRLSGEAAMKVRRSFLCAGSDIECCGRCSSCNMSVCCCAYDLCVTW